MTRTDDPTTVALLALARLLPAGEKGEARDKLAKDLRPLVGHRWEGAAWDARLDAALDELDNVGALGRIKKGKAERLTLTAEGRRLALKAIGLEELPPKTTWAKLKSPYLLALALGRPAATPADAKRIAGAPGLKAELLRARYGLELGERPTLKQATDALAGKLLRDAGIELRDGQALSVKAIQEALLRRELGEPGAKNPLDLIVARSVGARQGKTSELGEAALRAWVDRSEPDGTPPPAPSPRPAGLDLDRFARLVVQAARSSPGGWFGDDKVFIGHVWRAVRFDEPFRGLDFEGFKARLVEAHRARLIELGRADLVEAMDPHDVRESATPYLNAVYHFVRTEEDAR